jgi:hypothetical protein
VLCRPGWACIMEDPCSYFCDTCIWLQLLEQKTQRKKGKEKVKRLFRCGFFSAYFHIISK